MSKYGEVALLALVLLRRAPSSSPRDAWRAAAARIFPDKPASREKGCPKAAFLGLCEDGLVVGVRSQPCGAGTMNKSYAIESVRLLLREPSLAGDGPGKLWRRVMRGRKKQPNGQMDVVLALWERSLIAGSSR